MSFGNNPNGHRWRLLNSHTQMLECTSRLDKIYTIYKWHSESLVHEIMPLCDYDIDILMIFTENVCVLLPKYGQRWKLAFVWTSIKCQFGFGREYGWKLIGSYWASVTDLPHSIKCHQSQITQAFSYYQRYMRAINSNDFTLNFNTCTQKGKRAICVNDYILVLMKYFSDIYQI